MKSFVKSKAYVTAGSAKQRCENKNHKQYAQYGGRGIQFKFSSVIQAAKYIASLPGYDPEGGRQCTLDRIDNNGHYERGNLRWTTAKGQANNRSNNNAINRMLYPLIRRKNKVRKYSLNALAREYGVSVGTIKRIVEKQ